MARKITNNPRRPVARVTDAQAARMPNQILPGEGYAGEGGYGDDGPLHDTPPLYRAGRATPDRSQEPRIGPAAGSVRANLVADEAWDPAPRFTDELRSGVEMGTCRGNNDPEGAGTRQEFGDARRERRGVRTRPPRPGQWR